MSAVINVQPWLKFTATTVGRDKLYRGIQYFSRFLAWYLSRQGASKETVARFNNLKKTLALSRKLMRFGKPIEHLESAVLATSVKDEFLRFCAVAKQLSYAGYLTFDGLIFIDGANVYKFKNIKRYNELANKEQLTINKGLLQDGLDMLIPSTGLGYVDLDDGAVGLIGTITSIMGAQSQWAKVNNA
ncbi:Peroxisomal membrane protein PMP27 [Podila epicladia]|nr:Peroxisomal membrane protein PMP27 [Podila epicladia]